MAKRKKTGDDSGVNPQGSTPDDTFGLPEIEYQPIRREEPAPEPEPEPEPTPDQADVRESESVMEERPEYETENASESEYSYSAPAETPPVWPKVVGILLVVVLALAALWYFLVYQPNQKKEQERVRQEQLAQEEAKRKQAEADRLRQQQEEAERRRQDSLAAIPATGTVESLSERTGRYYVVAASAVDDDLLMDYAKKLSEKGVSSKLIPPFGKHKVFRLTIADGDSFAAAQETANTMKAEYGDALWVLKY